MNFRNRLAFLLMFFDKKCVKFLELFPCDLPAYLPVNMLYLLGVQIAVETNALLNTIPLFAKPSIIGVYTFVSPLNPKGLDWF